MSKKLLRIISEKTEQEIGKFNKKNEVQAKHGGIRVGKLKTEDQEAYERAVEDGDIHKAVEILNIGFTAHTELYLNMPDLKVSDNGSIKSLSVRVYSAQVNDNTLLHKLFGKIREQS